MRRSFIQGKKSVNTVRGVLEDLRVRGRGSTKKKCFSMGGTRKVRTYLAEVNLLCFVYFGLWLIRKGNQFFLKTKQNGTQKGQFLLLALTDISLLEKKPKVELSQSLYRLAS